MPAYQYKCGNCGYEEERRHGMSDAFPFFCPRCQRQLHRVPQPVRINWNGLAPSAGELAPDVQAAVDNAAANRDRFAAIHEAHESRID